MRQSIETSLAPGAGHMSHMSRPEAHRLDELSAGYCLAGCSPAAPASAFPAVSEYCNSVARKSTIFQRTGTVSLCRCLSLGVHTIVLLALAELFVPVCGNTDGGSMGSRPKVWDKRNTIRDHRLELNPHTRAMGPPPLRPDRAHEPRERVASRKVSPTTRSQ